MLITSLGRDLSIACEAIRYFLVLGRVSAQNRSIVRSDDR